MVRAPSLCRKTSKIFNLISLLIFSFRIGWTTKRFLNFNSYIMVLKPFLHHRNEKIQKFYSIKRNWMSETDFQTLANKRGSSPGMRFFPNFQNFSFWARQIKLNFQRMQIIPNFEILFLKFRIFISGIQNILGIFLKPFIREIWIFGFYWTFIYVSFIISSYLSISGRMTLFTKNLNY